MSYAEILFEESLKLVISDNEQYLKNYRPDWLKNITGRNLEYDFYIPKLKIAFEIEGIHHYTDENQIERDNLKWELSKKNGVILFELSLFQINPTTIRRKLINYSFKINEIFNIKPYDEEKFNITNEKIKQYKQTIINKYGINESQNQLIVLKSNN